MSAPKPSNKPASKPADRKPGQAAAPLIDYSSLTAETAEIPRGMRASVLDGTPFVQWLTESRDQKIAKSVTVPNAAAKQTVYLIRAAAGRIKSGVRVVESKPSATTTKVTFQAKPKRRTKAEKAAANVQAAIDSAAPAEASAPVA